MIDVIHQLFVVVLDLDFILALFEALDQYGMVKVKRLYFLLTAHIIHLKVIVVQVEIKVVNVRFIWLDRRLTVVDTSRLL